MGHTMEILVYAVLPAFLFLFFVVQYLGLRIRDMRARQPDPHLGRKALLYFFFNLSVFLVLLGLTSTAVNLCDYVMLSDPPGVAPPPYDWFSSAHRNGAAFVMTGVFYAALFLTLIRVCTNDRTFPTVGRAFAASRLAVAVLILMICSTVVMLTLFDKETNRGTLSQTMAYAVVWGPFALIHFVLVLRGGGPPRED